MEVQNRSGTKLRSETFNKITVHIYNSVNNHFQLYIGVFMKAN